MLKLLILFTTMVAASQSKPLLSSGSFTYIENHNRPISITYEEDENGIRVTSPQLSPSDEKNVIEKIKQHHIWQREFDQKMNVFNQEMDQFNHQLNTGLNELNHQLNQQNNQFGQHINQFNQQVNQHNQRVNQFNQQLNQHNQDLNQLHKELKQALPVFTDSPINNSSNSNSSSENN